MRLEDMSEEEKQYQTLSVKLLKAKTDEEVDAAMKEIRKFEKKHPAVVDEIQSRRWTEYPGDPSY